MVSKEDWAAAMSSEIFREYVKLSLNSTSVPQKPNENQILSEFEVFQSKIRSNPKMKQVFKALQAKFASDFEYRNKVNQDFVEGVMLLDLSDSNTEE